MTFRRYPSTIGLLVMAPALLLYILWLDTAA
jgi:hypothetical protein